MLSSCRRLRPRVPPCVFLARRYASPSVFDVQNSIWIPHPNLPDAPPPIAPKPIVDVAFVRNNVAYHKQNCKNRNYREHLSLPDEIARIHRFVQKLRETLLIDRKRMKELQITIRELRMNRDEATRSMRVNEAKQLNVRMGTDDQKEKVSIAKMHELAMKLPNRTAKVTPIGNIPRLIETIGEKPEVTWVSVKGREGRYGGKGHVEIGAECDLLELTAATKVSGWGFYFFKNEAVMLEQAIINYALSLARKKGWQLASTPSMVYKHMAEACGFQPRDESDKQQIYGVVEAPNKIPHVLAGTAEIPLAGLYADQTLYKLPLKICGIGRAFRPEAGSRGTKTKGLYRVHEFSKVELFAWTPPDQPFQRSEDGESEIEEPEIEESDIKESEIEESEIEEPEFDIKESETEESEIDESEDNILGDKPLTPGSTAYVFREMFELQKELVASLGLHARVLEMPTSDLGASAGRKIDIEVFMPSRGKTNCWGEVSSLSNCYDYQTRRLATKYKKKHLSEFPYTLNGTAAAVPRLVHAVLEYGWSDEKGGGVVVPECLRPFMGGMDWISKKEAPREVKGTNARV